MWTASRNCLYMSVTAHWLDDNFGTYNKCLTVTSDAGSYTADFISSNSATVI